VNGWVDGWRIRGLVVSDFRSMDFDFSGLDCVRLLVESGWLIG
jgi:hypothetical protein